MVDPIEVVPYDCGWPAAFAVVARQLRGLLGSVALRIDHVGSTAIFGLDAKPVIDVQVSVAALEPHDLFSRPLEGSGFVFRRENPERTKRYFREPAGERRTHIHVRRAGSFSEQFALLFRDYLRQNGERAKAYGELKRVLAVEFRDDRQGYVDAKGTFIWETVRLADAWAQATGWEPGPSDA
jgi:GrpB-like predicted nucleotidyltransferase (UPF0157 family)